jgi:hypothetical protein
MQSVTVTVGPLASASANAICLSQSPGAAGALTLNGALVVSGVAVLDVARRVLITCAASEVGKSFVITGTNTSGNTQSETVAGPAATAQSVLDYKTVTSITISAASAGAITVGTNGVASSRWINLDGWALPQVAIQCTVTGTANFTVQQTMDNPNDAANPVSPDLVTWVNHPDTNLVAATATVQGNYGYAPAMMRVLLNSGSGSVKVTVRQSGVVSI